MGEVTTIGLDLAKHVFQVHGVDAEGATVLRKQLRRAQVLAFFSRLPRCLVGMEACGTAHYWARELRALGHEVRLMPAQYVKAYVKRNKNDAADAAAICEAVVRPTMRFVAVKTAEQQAAVLLHRGRERLVRQRTGLVNALRAHLAEFGIIAPQGLRHVGRLTAIVRDEGEARLPDLARQVLQVLAARLSSWRRRLRRSRSNSWPGIRATRSASGLRRSLASGRSSLRRSPRWLRSRAVSAAGASLRPGLV
jgi:transposase